MRFAPILIAILSIVVISTLLYPTLVTSQPTNSQLNTVIQDVHKAESSGANQNELSGLIQQLNSVIELQTKLQNVPQQDEGTRTQILTQINKTLTTIDAEANQIEINASQRTYINHLVAYASGIFGAALVTLTCHCIILLGRKYRIKRTFQMKVTPK